MKIVTALGRIIFALPFIGFGLNHFRKPNLIASYIPDYIPWHLIWVYFTGVFFVLTGISMIVNYKSRYMAFALAGVIFLLTIIIYLPSLMSSKMAIANYTVFIGGALLVAATGKK